MNKVLLAAFTAVTFSAGTGMVGAADPLEEKEVKPTLSERITQATIKGTLMKMAGQYYSVKDTDGREIKLYVDANTKLDKVMAGDKVKAYVDDSMYATTLQRDE